MKSKLFHMIIFVCLLLTSCNASEKSKAPIASEEEKEVSAAQAIIEKTEYKLYRNISRPLSLYEPKEGCYLGAYILSNSDINFDIETFEKITETSHGIYLRNMKLGAIFPIDWVLECTSRMKTPYIILQPPSEDFPYQDYLLEETAKEFGYYFIPMFVQFYPNPHQYDNPQAYKDFFIKARNIFKEYAPNVAFIWSVNLENCEDSLIYYPGDEAVDWVGIDVYDLIYTNNEKNDQNLFEDIDFVYYSFQGKKPMMISQLGISHYSNKDHGYYIDEAANKISAFYNTIRNQYPQIKGINYMDFNNIEAAPNDMGQDNFKITSQEQLTEAYKNALKYTYFIDSLDIQSSSSVEEQWIVSFYPIYKQNDKIYVSEKVIKYEWEDLGIMNQEEKPIWVNDDAYYSLENIIQNSSLNMQIDFESNKIKIQ
ncbi:glycosyl hydrolase [Defluviitalea saccharophila]|uniref:Glycosyl hydrolase n=1 Tax=Defluviitalea saccharophila TaxID=879970 RepID=A0ABZ2Y7W1_9FIRM|nr:hypothetical protein [Candidatus Epulonipiscium sp.]